MKVEAGESLIFSWARHVLGCQIVQLNWKASSQWGIQDIGTLESIITEMGTLFIEKHQRRIYNKGKPDQLLRQGEIDVLGIKRDPDGSLSLIAVDIANHVGGLNLGQRDITIARVLKKMVRSAVSVHGYFPGIPAKVLFVSPKIDGSTQRILTQCIADLEEALQSRGIPIEVSLVCNEEFATDILEPVIECASSVSDTSELFLRSVQIWAGAGRPAARGRSVRNYQVRNDGPSETGIAGVKIGQYVQAQVALLAKEGLISQEEVENLLTPHYMKQTFNVSKHPFLRRNVASNLASGDEWRKKFWVNTFRINGQDFYVCSQWEAKHWDKFDAWVKALRTKGNAKGSSSE